MTRALMPTPFSFNDITVMIRTTTDTKTFTKSLSVYDRSAVVIAVQRPLSTSCNGIPRQRPNFLHDSVLLHMIPFEPSQSRCVNTNVALLSHLPSSSGCLHLASIPSSSWFYPLLLLTGGGSIVGAVLIIDSVVVKM